MVHLILVKQMNEEIPKINHWVNSNKTTELNNCENQVILWVKSNKTNE